MGVIMTKKGLYKKANDNWDCGIGKNHESKRARENAFFKYDNKIKKRPCKKKNRWKHANHKHIYQKAVIWYKSGDNRFFDFGKVCSVCGRICREYDLDLYLRQVMGAKPEIPNGYIEVEAK